MSSFEPFGSAHVATLLVLSGAAVGLVGLARRPEFRRPIRTALVLVLVGGVALHLSTIAARRPLQLEDVLPLHLCDMAIVLALVALVTRAQRVTELLYFWTVTGTALAMVTPALRDGFPSLRYLTYFGLHGGVLLAAVVLVFGEGIRPRSGGALRAWLFTNVYAAMVFAVDLALDENYLYLRAKPRGATLLDAFGPWPIYIVVVELVALALFGIAAFASAPRRSHRDLSCVCP